MVTFGLGVKGRVGPKTRGRVRRTFTPALVATFVVDESRVGTFVDGETGSHV